jgi:hypothetical protein
MKELERFVAAGVYVWYMVIAGLQMLEVGSRVSGVEVGVGLSWREAVKVSIGYGIEEGKREMFVAEGSFYGVEGVSSWGISSGRLVVDAGLGSVGIAKGEVVGGMFEIGVSEDFSLKEDVESRLFAKSDNRYIVAVPFRNVAPLGFVVNWLTVNEDVVILS